MNKRKIIIHGCITTWDMKFEHIAHIALRKNERIYVEMILILFNKNLLDY